MKLKCESHGRRVLAVSTNPGFLHRNGDMSKCTDGVAVLVDPVEHITRSFRIVLGKIVEFDCLKKSGPHTKKHN
jgi:hypothetical protein